MRLGDLDALKEEFDIIANNSETNEWQTLPINHIKKIIDKAPTINKCDNCDLMLIAKIRSDENDRQ